MQHPRTVRVVVDHYGAGVRFERAVKDDLEANGYVVTRAASSKGKLDLIGVKGPVGRGELLFVQCKRGGLIGPAEWDRVVELAGWVNATALLAMAGRTVAEPVYWQLLGPKKRGRILEDQPARLWTPDHGFDAGGHVQVVAGR